MFGRLPFNGATDQDIWEQIALMEYKIPENLTLGEKPLRILKAMLDKDSEKRQKIYSILNEVFLISS